METTPSGIQRGPTRLEETLRGWANTHRHVVASEAFSRIDTDVFEQLRRMLRRRHPKKSRNELIKNYWSAAGRHEFAALAKTAKIPKKIYKAVRVSAIGFRRYVKIKADANPYMPEHGSYFWRHRHKQESKMLLAVLARELRGMTP